MSILSPVRKRKKLDGGLSMVSVNYFAQCLPIYAIDLPNKKGGITMTTTFKHGDRIKYSAKFLKSIQLHEGHFVGTVIGSDGFTAMVQWDGSSTPNKILVKNIVPETMLELE